MSRHVASQNEAALTLPAPEVMMQDDGGHCEGGHAMDVQHSAINIGALGIESSLGANSGHGDHGGNGLFESPRHGSLGWRGGGGDVFDFGFTLNEQGSNLLDDSHFPSLPPPEQMHQQQHQQPARGSPTQTFVNFNAPTTHTLASPEAWKTLQPLPQPLPSLLPASLFAPAAPVARANPAALSMHIDDSFLHVPEGVPVGIHASLSMGVSVPTPSGVPVGVPADVTTPLPMLVPTLPSMPPTGDQIKQRENRIQAIVASFNRLLPIRIRFEHKKHAFVGTLVGFRHSGVDWVMCIKMLDPLVNLRSVKRGDKKGSTANVLPRHVAWPEVTCTLNTFISTAFFTLDVVNPISETTYYKRSPYQFTSTRVQLCHDKDEWTALADLFPADVRDADDEAAVNEWLAHMQVLQSLPLPGIICSVGEFQPDLQGRSNLLGRRGESPLTLIQVGEPLTAGSKVRAKKAGGGLVGNRFGKGRPRKNPVKLVNPAQAAQAQPVQPMMLQQPMLIPGSLENQELPQLPPLPPINDEFGDLPDAPIKKKRGRKSKAQLAAEAAEAEQKKARKSCEGEIGGAWLPYLNKPRA